MSLQYYPIVFAYEIIAVANNKLEELLDFLCNGIKVLWVGWGEVKVRLGKADCQMGWHQAVKKQYRKLLVFCVE